MVKVDENRYGTVELLRIENNNSGLILVRDFASEKEEKELVNFYKEEWNHQKMNIIVVVVMIIWIFSLIRDQNIPFGTMLSLIITKEEMLQLL